MDKLERTSRTTRVGVVQKISSPKTVVVVTEDLKAHPIYKKTVRRSKKFLVHVEAQKELQIGDKVMIMSSRRLSKRKNWRLCKVIKDNLEA